ncbi:hypothetical protein HPB47_003882, partial [Ixodes persulcatus]
MRRSGLDGHVSSKDGRARAFLKWLRSAELGRVATLESARAGTGSGAAAPSSYRQPPCCKLTPELLGAKPNTYVFTKSLAESIVAEHGRGLPLVIVRPSIVSASWREPFPGWVEGLHGGNFLVASGVSGVLTTLVANRNAVMDLVPVDIVASTLIVAACQAAPGERNTSRQQLREEPAVYNCTSGATNKVLYGEAARLTTVQARRYPSNLPFGRPGVAVTMSPTYQAVAVFVFNYLPALIFDLMRQGNGKN